VIGIFDVLIACVAAWVLCDQFLTSVNYDSVGLDTQFQQGSGVFERYSVVVGFEGDPAAVGGGHATAAADIITGEWKGLEGWLFLLEEVAGLFAHFAVEADVGDLLHPTTRLGIECFQRRWGGPFFNRSRTRARFLWRGAASTLQKLRRTVAAK
jgi:hypothetical protein